MAIKINNIEVINNNRKITSITGIGGGTSNLYNEIRVVSGNATAFNRDYILVTNVSGAIITLPSSPVSGNEIVISSRQVNTIIERNGSKIMGISTNFTMDIPNSTVNVTYINSDFGWLVS